MKKKTFCDPHSFDSEKRDYGNDVPVFCINEMSLPGVYKETNRAIHFSVVIEEAKLVWRKELNDAFKYLKEISKNDENFVRALDEIYTIIHKCFYSPSTIVFNVFSFLPTDECIVNIANKKKELCQALEQNLKSKAKTDTKKLFVIDHIIELIISDWPCMLDLKNIDPTNVFHSKT